MPAGRATRSVLVTGAGRGLGHELCQVYLRRGWTVFPLVRTAASAAGFRTAPAGRCHPIVADVRSDDAMADVSSAVAARTTGLDLLVNNAGIAGDAVQLASVTPLEVSQLIDVHCLGALRCTRAVLPQLVAPPGATVVNVSSQWGSLSRSDGRLPVGGASYSYRIAKAAQNMLTVCMSEELGPLGVVVCALHPGEFRSSVNPESAVSAAAAAGRVARWADGVRETHGGRWYHVDTGAIAW